MTGAGFGGSLAKDAQGNPLQGKQSQQSSYEGFEQNDSEWGGRWGW